MIYELSNEFDLEKFLDKVKNLVDSKKTVELKTKNPKRSLRQNSYLHLILGWFACNYGCSAEEAKLDFFKRKCNKEIFEKERSNSKGQRIRYLISTSELDSGQMTLAIERFRNWSASEAELYLPDPSDLRYLQYVEKEIEKNKEFI